MGKHVLDERLLLRELLPANLTCQLAGPFRIFAEHGRSGFFVQFVEKPQAGTLQQDVITVGLFFSEELLAQEKMYGIKKESSADLLFCSAAFNYDQYLRVLV